jgi:hypothetical protein
MCYAYWVAEKMKTQRALGGSVAIFDKPYSAFGFISFIIKLQLKKREWGHHLKSTR